MPRAGARRHRRRRARRSGAGRSSRRALRGRPCALGAARAGDPNCSGEGHRRHSSGACRPGRPTGPPGDRGNCWCRPSERDELSVQESGVDGERGEARGQHRHACRPVVPVAGDAPSAAAGAPAQETVAVELELGDPVRSGRRIVGGSRELRRLSSGQCPSHGTDGRRRFRAGGGMNFGHRGRTRHQMQASAGKGCREPMRVVSGRADARQDDPEAVRRG